jgi:hypothetical protein
MGFNTTVIVLNDALHAIAEDPQFGKKLAAAVMSLGSGRKYDAVISAMNHVNAATAIESHHADAFSVVAIGGNMGAVLGYGGGYRNTNEEILKALASSMGFVVHRKPAKRKKR